MLTPGNGIQSLIMLVALFLMRLCEIVFFTGVVGSLVVVVISFVEDIHELIGE